MANIPDTNPARLRGIAAHTDAALALLDRLEEQNVPNGVRVLSGGDVSMLRAWMDDIKRLATGA